MISDVNVADVEVNFNFRAARIVPTLENVLEAPLRRIASPSNHSPISHILAGLVFRFIITRGTGGYD